MSAEIITYHLRPDRNHYPPVANGEGFSEPCLVLILPMVWIEYDDGREPLVRQKPKPRA